MKKNRVSLLDRASADLEAVERLLPVVTDEVMVDICAYHCQQCIEKAVKFAIELTGTEYSVRHDLYIVIEDLDDEELKELVSPVISHVDAWISSTRYGTGIRSSRTQVEKVLDVCRDVIALLRRRLPAKE